MCACELTEEKVQLHNTGAVTSTYMVFNKGEAKEWVDIAPATFFLEPGETKEIKQFIKVPCSAQGEYNLNTTIKTLFDTEKTIQQKLNVQNCPNVKITPLFSGIQQECPCTPVQYSFEVLNIGNHIETYEISVEPHSEAIALSLPILILEPGEKQTVDVFINLPCGEYGEKIFTFNAKAQGTQILGQLDFALNIDKCYEYDVAMADEYNICEGVPNIIPYQVQNNAEIANTYFIETTGLDWVQPENNTISAWGKEIIDSNIVLFPPVTQEGDDVNIFAVRSLSTRGEEIVEKEIIVTSQKCYNYQFAETEIHLTECEKQETGITIQNTGSREGTYTIYTEGPEWFNTLNENVLVQTEEILTLPISAEVPCEVGEYPLNVYTTIEEINQTYLEEKKIVVHSKEEAHLPQIEIPEITLWYDGIEELIQITNVGYKETTYDLGLVTGNWVTINTPTVTLQPGETTTVILAAYPTEDVIQDTYAAELIATVRGEPIEYAAQFELTIGQESPLMKYLIPILIASSILIILIIVVLALLLTGKKTDKKIPGVGEEVVEQKPTKKTHKITEREYAKKTKKGKKSIWPWVIGIFIILALLGAAFYGATTIFTQQGNETVSEEVVDELTELEKEIEELENTVTEVSEEAQEPEVLTNEHIVDSLISIDRSAVQGKGNEIIVDSEEQITLPMIIKNPTERKAKLEITSPESDWIEFERTTIAIKAESEEIVNVIISPKLEELAENDYSAKITALLEGQKIYYEEELELVVTKEI
jgi:flagellar basal body-associated protein FliL